MNDSIKPDLSEERYRKLRRAYWDSVARQLDTWQGWGGYYHRRLMRVYQSLVPAGQRVLELGCGRGDLLAALDPCVGVGIDLSGEMIERAQRRHPELRFVHADIHEVTLSETFDTIILSDLVNDLWDVQAVLQCIKPLTHPRTRIIFNTYSRLWELPLAIAEHLGLAKPTLYQNWLTVQDITGLCHLTGFELFRRWQEVLLPLGIPILEAFYNQFLVRLPGLKHIALTNFLVARPIPEPGTLEKKPSVSVVIPARNEAGNIEAIFARVPTMGSATELVFVEGHSRDNTYEVIEQAIAQHPERACKLLRQNGTGKGDAVRLGFANSSGDMLMILDADLTMPPEDLPRYFDALCQGKAEFANGVRLVYPMEKQAMRLLNFLGNKFFGLAFSWLLGQPIKDTLCGTKVLWRTDYELIAKNRAYFGDFDPFGDFDLLFGAARLNLRIVDVPIRYRDRTYGTTNIQRWKHGWLLLRMVLFAARRIKFI